MRTAPMGPSKGMPESIRAARGAVDGEHVVGVHQVGGEDGAHDVDLVAEAVGEARAQRAVDQAAGEDGLVGGLALTTEERAGDACPAAYMRSSMSTVSGKKSAPSRADLAAVAVTRTTVSPMLDRDGTVGLAGELAGLEGQGLVGAPGIRASVRRWRLPWCVSFVSGLRGPSRGDGGTSSQW